MAQNSVLNQRRFSRVSRQQLAPINAHQTERQQVASSIISDLNWRRFNN